MHMMKKCGGTPCDRRLGRRKVAIAAAAVLLVFATTAARAGVVDFVIDEAASSLTLSGTVDLSAAGGPPAAPLAPQTNFMTGKVQGNISHYWGDLYVDVQLATVQPQAYGAGYTLASGPDAAVLDGHGNYATGLYLPNPVSATPPGPGNYGISVPAVGAFSNHNGVNLSPSSAYAPNAPLALVPTGPGTFAFSVAPDIWVFAKGFYDLVSGLGGSHTNLATGFSGGPFPFPLGGTLDVTSGVPVFTPNATIGTWDTVTQTLTINVNGTLKFPISSSPFIPLSQTFTGALVMHPRVPEPSTVMLLGCGIVGLLTCAWRKRRAA